MKNTPIKRSVELRPLSREHHDGLLLCWKIRTALKRNIETERIRRYVLASFEQELNPHFSIEERHVFPLANGQVLEELALQDHRALSELAEALRADTEGTRGWLADFAELLDKHIRLEERELFPWIETNAEPEALTAAAKAILKAEAGHAPLEWKDEFWMTAN